MFTDVFGELPYSEAADATNPTPKFDTQSEIYQGIIADLDAAMATIGDNERTGSGVDDLGENDLYCKGDLQKWKKLAEVDPMGLPNRITIPEVARNGYPNYWFKRLGLLNLDSSCNSSELSTESELPKNVQVCPTF